MFRDREDAALKLAERLKGRRLRNPLVLAIPRGGVVTGAVVAEKLGAELDVVLVRKLRAPDRPEFAIGAISEEGCVYLDPDALSILGVPAEYLQAERRVRLEELSRRASLFRSARPRAPIAGRSVIVVDDGLATGSTMMAALQVVRGQAPYELIVAVPVAPPDRIEEVRAWCDEVVCVHAPEFFLAISNFYESFPQVEDDTALEILARFAPSGT
ncbi:MAG: phosphoribosyltransferase [Planctomycetes bacterium]|nr:phosphoribosyltransferase [Planctomycetota bacterium]MBI3846980.1 phosphoribosyltransferase [Planctomycetota bacterium]